MAFHVTRRSEPPPDRPISSPPSESRQAHEKGSAEPFADLDGRRLVVLGRTWQILVFSMLQVDWARYLQISLQGEPTYMVTVQLCGGCSSRDVVTALVRWLTHPTSSGALIRVG